MIPARNAHLQDGERKSSYYHYGDFLCKMPQVCGFLSANPRQG